MRRVFAVLPPSELLGQSIARARSLARGAREAVAQIKHALRRPFIERSEREAVEQLETWLDTWFSLAGQERLAEAVARISARR